MSHSSKKGWKRGTCASIHIHTPHSYSHTLSLTQKTQDSRDTFPVKKGKAREGMDALILLMLSPTLACSLLCICLGVKKQLFLSMDPYLSYPHTYYVHKKNFSWKLYTQYLPSHYTIYYNNVCMLKNGESCIPPTSTHAYYFLHVCICMQARLTCSLQNFPIKILLERATVPTLRYTYHTSVTNTFPSRMGLLV